MPFEGEIKLSRVSSQQPTPSSHFFTPLKFGCFFTTASQEDLTAHLYDFLFKYGIDLKSDSGEKIAF